MNINESLAKDRWDEINEGLEYFSRKEDAATQAHIRKVVDYLNSENGPESVKVYLINVGVRTIYRDGRVEEFK